MPTINQLVRKGRRNNIRKPDRALQGCPQKRGTVLKVWVVKPRKPNSGDRKMVRVRLSNKVEVTASIPGQGLGGVQQHSQVLVRKGRVQDVPGVNYKIVRGALDCQNEDGRSYKTMNSRKKARSRFGAKRPKA